MQSTRFYKIAIAVLVVLNISTLTFMWMAHRQNPAPRGPAGAFEFLAKELKLDDTQLKQFDEMHKALHEEATQIREKNHAMHHRFFDLLHVQNDSGLVKQLADSMAYYQVQMELLTFNHFKKIRGICRPEQQKKFDEVINQALEMMGPRPGGPPRGPGGPEGPPPPPPER
ncbi:MAG: Spy/CpxP family protein refolding chaperone [Bacteroidia bacterium]